jgi:pyruvate-formate lyase
MIDLETCNNCECVINPLIAQAAEFTQAYKQHQNEPLAIREAMCIKKQYPALLKEIRSEDLFAGRRTKDRISYVGTIWWSAFPIEPDGPINEGKQGGFCFDFSAVNKLASNKKEKQILEELTDFWKNEATVVKTLGIWDEELKKYVGNNRHISANSIGFSIAVNLDRLLHKGIQGLMEDVNIKKLDAEKNAGDTSFYTGLQIALEVVIDVCHFYEDQARELAGKSNNPEEQNRLNEIAQTLAGIVAHPPQSFREAIQLVWIYTLLAGGKHLEAWGLDIALGDFYVNDIDHGIISEEEGIEMILSLWRLFNENGEDATCRIMIGGRGRRNEANADRFALAAMEATKRHKRVTPQLTLRFHKDQNPELLHNAYDAIKESYTYPLLYNDDVIIPGVAKALGVSTEVAERYHPLGCGEYMLGGCSPSMLDANWDIPKSVEAVLRNGFNSNGGQMGPQTGAIDTFDTFEKLYAAFIKQIRFAANLIAKIYENICKVLPKECSFLYASLLTDDCMERGSALFDGGMLYKGACAMGHGFTNAADSLTAIRKLVYHEKRITLAQLLSALDANFEGYESTRKLLLDAPKYGNNNDQADQMLVKMWQDINAAIKEAGEAYGLDFLTVSSVNPGGYWMGFSSGATADGRKKGQAFAIGNSPTAGYDRNGLTSLLNSLSKVDPANGGAVSNIKISREFFTEERTKLEALFGAFFAKGGMQANLSVVNKEDLEAALKEPEKFPHVLVRLGGWTARFIDLDRNIQEEIMGRTLY